MYTHMMMSLLTCHQQTAQGELPADPWSHGIGQRHALALEHLASARQAAEASWGQPLLREGTQLRSRVKVLREQFAGNKVRHGLLTCQLRRRSQGKWMTS
jgi:hypothetical protein